MNIHDIYDYLTRSRRDLWSALENAPDEALCRPLLNGDRFHCIKDLVSHIPAVEDGWVHEDILRTETVWSKTPPLSAAGDFFDSFELKTLLDYWRSVEQSTLDYLAMLTEDELKRVVTVHDAPDDHYTVDGLLWHVMIHEMRHTAQIALLLRLQDIKPPSFDLSSYLPSA